jgi:hypothetical protein
MVEKVQSQEKNIFPWKSKDADNTRSLQLWKEAALSCLVGTSGIFSGLDNSNVRTVVIIGAHSFEAMVQALGRAGRDNQKSLAYFFHFDQPSRDDVMSTWLQTKPNCLRERPFGELDGKLLTCLTGGAEFERCSLCEAAFQSSSEPLSDLLLPPPPKRMRLHGQNQPPSQCILLCFSLTNSSAGQSQSFEGLLTSDFLMLIHSGSGTGLGFHSVNPL